MMSNAIDRLSHAIDSTLNWLRVHFLKCIPSKTELIHFSSRFSKNLADLQIGSTKIESTNEIRNLGVQMDRHLHMRAQIRKVCRNSEAPDYLTDLITRKKSERKLRSNEMMMIEKPKIRVDSIGKRALSYISPELWNLLPVKIKICQNTDFFKKTSKKFMVVNS